MKLRSIGLVFMLMAIPFTGQAKAIDLEQVCQGWQVIEETEDYKIMEHYHSYRCVQTIQVTNHGNVYFLIAGPYGFDQITLNGVLPKRFPSRYLKKCCWLRRTKSGKKLVMTYGVDEVPNILIGNELTS